MSEVTRILSAIEQGDTRAAEQLLPLVYDELRKLAAQKLAHEQPGMTLQATALVHEAYLRLVAPSPQPLSPAGARGSAEKRLWDSRGHFFAAAAEAMRRILVEQARRRHAAKRGGQRQRVELSDSDLATSMPDDELLALNDALEQLATADPAAANLVRLRFFAGLNMTEAAGALGVSVRSAQDIWAYARSWLRRQMNSD
jgi:RNA polymerase sigma factor (TIGR02999 family)